MNFDIDDILNDFDSKSRRSLYSLQQQSIEDSKKMTQAWIAERMAPELLPYEQELVTRMLEYVRAAIEQIEMNSLDLKQRKDMKLHLMIAESELDRINFVIRSYIRCRLSKIDKYTLYIKQNEEILKRLSPDEVVYMEKHFAILVELYGSQFLHNFPAALQSLDGTSEGVSMVAEPDMNKTVFVQALEDVERGIQVGKEQVYLEKGGLYALRYQAILPYLKSGSVLLV